MSKELPTLRERWSQLVNNGLLSYEEIVLIYNYYVDFTVRILALWMFVPCDKEGKPMEKPNQEDYIGNNSPEDVLDTTVYDHDMKVFQEALDRCIFVGWEVNEEDTLLYKGHQLRIHPTGMLHYVFGTLKTIEDIIKLGVEPTARVIDELKLKV